MSYDEAELEELMEDFDRWKAREEKRAFLKRMESKFNRKVRAGRI